MARLLSVVTLIALCAAPPARAEPPSESAPPAGAASASQPAAPASQPAAPTSPPAPASQPAAAPTSPPTAVLLALDSNPAARDEASAVGSLLASVLTESATFRLVTEQELQVKLGPERWRQVLGPEEQGACGPPCMLELSREANARYVISGRLDRFGNTFVLTANLFDARTAEGLAKPHATAPTDAELPVATREIAQALQAPVLGAKGKAAASAASSGPESLSKVAVIALKGGSNFISSLQALSPAADVEVGYRFHREWVAFLQIGVAFVTAKATDETPNLGLNVVPTVVGARHLYGEDGWIQPYWGLGLGVQLSFGDYGPITRSGLLPTIIGFGGLQYLFNDTVGALVELKTDLAQATLGLFTPQGSVGLHLDLSLGLVLRF